jgi:hypothetical protein
MSLRASVGSTVASNAHPVVVGLRRAWSWFHSTPDLLVVLSMSSRSCWRRQGLTPDTLQIPAFDARTQNPGGTRGVRIASVDIGQMDASPDNASPPSNQRARNLPSPWQGHPNGQKRPTKTAARTGNRSRTYRDFVSTVREAKSPTGVTFDASTPWSWRSVTLRLMTWMWTLVANSRERSLEPNLGRMGVHGKGKPRPLTTQANSPPVSILGLGHLQLITPGLT